MDVLDLFSGIGGFSLGLERAGMRTTAFCEIDPFCRRILARHWPGVPCYDDVRLVTKQRLTDDGIFPDVICGGFPCQDISVAGKGAGLDGARSGLWSEYRRLIEEIRPAWIIIENVAVLRTRGLDTILSTLDALGYVGEWHLIPASAVGAPHLRDRIWIVAHTDCNAGDEGWTRDAAEIQGRRDVDRSGERTHVADPHSKSLGWSTISRGQCDHWSVEPDVGRVVNGVPERVDRLRALGNAVVPQIPELIGRAILRSEATVTSSH